MKPSAEILEFYKSRMKAHIESVNYFASLVGKKFPDHDDEKASAMSLCAFGYWRDYHPDFVVPDDPGIHNAFQCHRRGSPHHAEFYNDIALMPPGQIAEMVCDWFARSCERSLILRKNKYKSVFDFYERFALPAFKFTPAQQEQITDLISKIEKLWDKNQFLDIWRDVLNAVKVD